MDQLKKAMQRAQRDSRSLQVGKNSQTVVPLVPEINAPIHYSKTQVVQTNRKVLAKRRVFLRDDNHAASHAYKVLRTQVLQRMAVNNWNTLAVTSAGQGEGKTITAINLAINLAKVVSHTVLLADFDLRRPQVHQYFKYSPRCGLSDYLRHEIALPEILFNPQLDGLVILPGREPVDNSSELLSSPDMSRLVEELKSRYPARIVIFDLPPLLSGADVLAFLPHVEAVLLVVEEGKTQREDLVRSLELLRETNLLGTVLNKSQESRSGY